MKGNHAVVVGAGLGGLSAAAILARRGLDVDLFERNSYPGGYACSFVRGEFEFEASLHELSGVGPEGNRGGCYRVLEEADVARRVELLPIADFYSSKFPDFTVTIPHGWQAAEEAYVGQFPAEKDGIRRVMSYMKGLSDELTNVGEGVGPLDMLTLPLKIPRLIRATGITTAQALDREFKDPRLTALFCDIWGYYGLPPSRLSWQLFALANASYIQYGPYHVKGTSQALSNAFVDSIEENGGNVHLRNGVAKITVSDGAVTGVITESGDEVPADYVVCNANPIHVCYDLIGPEDVPGDYLKALSEGHIAISTFNVYMGLDCTADELGMEHHELFVNDSYNHDEHYMAMFGIGRQQYWALTCYNIADPEFSPPGTSVFVITCVMDYGAWSRVPPDRYVDTKNRMAAEMIDEAEKVLPGIKDHLSVVEVSTPITNMRYSMNPGGSILGFDYDLTHSPMFRLPNRGPLDRLYFGNAWVRMGGGFETCISSGAFAAGEVMKDVNGVKGLAKMMPGF